MSLFRKATTYFTRIYVKINFKKIQIDGLNIGEGRVSVGFEKAVL